MSSVYSVNSRAKRNQDPLSFYISPPSAFMQVGEALLEYVRLEELDRKATSPANVQLDPYLADALFKGVLKKGEVRMRVSGASRRAYRVDAQLLRVVT